MQEVGQPPRITPLSLLRNVTSSGQGTSAWPRDLLEAVMSAITCAERSSPGSSGALMGALPSPIPTPTSLHIAYCCTRRGHPRLMPHHAPDALTNTHLGPEMPYVDGKMLPLLVSKVFLVLHISGNYCRYRGKHLGNIISPLDSKLRKMTDRVGLET
jgi:hypothetical protein